MAGSEDPIVLQQIISRYETEEDEFLRELESMQQCANTDTSDDFQEESPVLGTLCSLVSEISELRKENRKLRRRLIVSTTPPERPRGVVNRVGAFLEGRHTILPRFIANAGETLGVGTRSGSPKKNSNVEIRTGARERLSSPPPKDSLTQSSYSTDLSSGTFSSSNSRYRKPPPLVLPEEMSDSDGENVFAEVNLPEYERPNDVDDENCLSPCRPRRSMVRRSQFSSISEHTSPSSASASSSVEPNDSMTASRSSFLEFIGLRRKRDKRSAQDLPPNSQTSPTKITVKKRKRKISESDSIDSSVHYSTQQLQKEKRSSLILPGTTGSDSLAAPQGGKMKDRSSGNTGGQSSSSNQIGWSGQGLGPGPPNKNVSKSLKNVADERQAKHQSRFYDESEDDYAKVEKKARPKSVIYLDPGDIVPKSKLKSKTKSTKSVSSRDTSASDRSNYAMEEDLQCMREENSLLRNEIQVLKTRNNRLIDQLREKSMQFSRLQGRSDDIETQLDDLRKKSQLNEALDRLCLDERLSIGSRAVMETVEEKLRAFDEKLQAIKSEALKNQQLTINSTVREQNTYQACLEQVERLQRENFSLLQLNATELASQDKLIRQKLDLMPSYDALYSFTMGIVRKLGQLRNLLIEKSNQVTQSELELMHAQSSLMIAHAQIERYRIQLQTMKRQRRRRPLSYHGEDLLENLVKPELNFYLPFQLHGSRIAQQKKSKISNLDNLVETNEQNIETEFLRLFDYARCLSKICEDSPPSRSKPLERAEHQVIIYRNGRATVSPTNSPILEPKHQSSHSPHLPRKNVRLAGIKEAASRRPISLVETKERPFSGNIRRFGEHLHKNPGEDLQNSNLNSPKLSNYGKAGHVKAIVSSLQDVSNSVMRSPTTTPVLTRKVALIGSPKGITERRLIKQSSLQHQNYGQAHHHQPVYDSPPRNGTTESSDYGTIGSGSNNQTSHYDVPKRELNNSPKNAATNPSQLGIIRRASLERRFQMYQLKQQQLQRAMQQNQGGRPLPTAPPVSQTGTQTRLPQPGSGERGNPGTSLRRAGAILRRNSPAGLYSSNVNPSSENSHTSLPILPGTNINQAQQTRNYVQAQNNIRFSAKTMPESPSLGVARAHRQIQSTPSHYAHSHAYPNPYGNVQHHEPMIREEEEHSSSMSEVSVSTAIDRSGATSSQMTTTISAAATSRLPKPSLQMERAKKAGTSWLSKLRLNTKKN